MVYAIILDKICLKCLVPVFPDKNLRNASTHNAFFYVSYCSSCFVDYYVVAIRIEYYNVNVNAPQRVLDCFSI